MELSNQLITVINAVCEKIGIVIDWSQKNVIPYLEDLVQRLVSYRMMELSVQLSFEIIAILCGIFIAWKTGGKAIKLYRQEDWEEPIFTFIVTISVIFAFISVFLLIFVYYDITDIIEVILIPEKYVISVLQGIA